MGECAPATAAAPTTSKTSVWWDIDKCAVPRGRCDPHRIAHNLIAALAAAGYAGPVSIAAYGDAARVPPPVLAALSATGICLNHVPAGSKDTSEKRMLVDMLFWAFDNPPPGNYLLISGDQDLSDLLHRLRMKRYDILLVRPPNASSQALAAAAKKVWLWENLTVGELLLPEPPPARSVLGCKLNVNSLDTLKCSQSKVCSEHGKGDSNGKAGNQNRVKPLQKYVKKASISSTPAITQDRVVPADGVSKSYTGSTLSEIDPASSLSSSSSSLACAKADTSVPQETPTLSKLPSHKSVLSTHSQQMEATNRSVPGEKPSTSTEWVLRNATLDLGPTNGHYNQMSQHLRPQNKLHSEFTTGGNKGKAVSQPGVKPPQKYVKKMNVTFGSAEKQVCSVRVHGRPIGNRTIEIDQASVSSSPTSTPSHSSAKKPVASAHLHQVKAPHESILGKKPSTSLEQVKASHESILGKPSTPVEQARVTHESILGKKPSTSAEYASRTVTHDFNVSTTNCHPACQQSHPSEAQNKLPCYSYMGDSGGKVGNEHKLNKDQVYVRCINVSSASASNEMNPFNGLIDNSKGITLSYPSQSLTAIPSSKSLESAKANDSIPLLSAHKSLKTDHLHQDGAASAFGNKISTSFQCTGKDETFVFGVSSGQYHPTYPQAQSSLLPEQHNSGTHPHIESPRGSSASQSVVHNGVSSAQIQTWSSGSPFDGLDYMCIGFSRLNISECPRGTAETTSFQGAPTNDPSMKMPDISGHLTGFHDSRSCFHLGSNTSCYLNHSSDPKSSHPPCSDNCGAGHQPNLSIDMQSYRHSGDKPEYLPDSPRNEGFDVKKALELAIQHEAVVMKKLLHDMPLFVAKDESLWKCVNVTNSKAKNPIEELERVHKYISSPDGYSAVKNSQSRYQAATILKRSCLQHCALGDILQVLHIVIVRKKWIVPHSSGWQPLSINTTDIATTDATAKVKS
uniref:NYN domain-containing protein n=1 Tax=Setaria viridis TaxID=4556 RepID=A0A4U6T620_SETVI|nr:hypothetical protein SEVIR_9G394400v2 [Setaria viridis]